MDSIEAVGLKIWGDLVLNREITLRWLQGFEFSESEPTALLQRRGGPCGVIAAVQGMLLKHLIYPQEGELNQHWRTPEDTLVPLVHALASMLGASRADDSSVIKLVVLNANDEDVAKYHDVMVGKKVDGDSLDAPVLFFQNNADVLEIEDVETTEGILLSMLMSFQGPFGVMLFLYSAVITRGLLQIESDQGFDPDTFVSYPFGHANQSLVNLLLTGEAVLNVWDGDRDAGGLVIKGIQKRGRIGYLTLLESLQYCHVGEFLKNPNYPIWIIGSESHFTTLFSLDSRLVFQESPIDAGRRIFEEYSCGSGFVEEKHLAKLLSRLEKDASNDSVDALKKKICLDGIVLASDFLNEVFPNQTGADVPTNFVIYHCNGIARPGEEVQYCRGIAKTANPTDIGQPDIMRCLWTKWQPLDVQWDNNLTPTIT
eukprot:m.80495 g.80495  ORF g.80495 m.80495 type:complete len:427 (+) comp8622_c0_seq3:104-1384(+)